MDIRKVKKLIELLELSNVAEIEIHEARSRSASAATAPSRRLQHEMARQSELVSHSYGKDPNRYVRIFRE